MMCYRDKTFCASPNCKNECGRKITDKQRDEAEKVGLPIAWGYFCGEPEVKQMDILGSVVTKSREQ